MQPSTKRGFHWATLAVFVLLACEVASFVGVHLIGVVDRNRRLDLFVIDQLAGIDDEAVRHFIERGFDADLGWDTVPSSKVLRENSAGEIWSASYDEDGGRTSCSENDSVLAAVFGDSFAHGDEVNDEQTFPCALERLTGQRIQNFGVGAFGTGQAILKAKRHWSRGPVPPITILSIFPEDLVRTPTQYRAFMHPLTRIKLGFKPASIVIDEEVVFVPNPLTADTNTVAEVRSLILALSTTDHFAIRNVRLTPRFPYLTQTLRILAHIPTRMLRIHHDPSFWNVDDGRRLIESLVADFTSSARAVGTRPIVLLLPDVSTWRDGRIEEPYMDFVRDYRRQNPAGAEILVVAESEFDEARYNIVPYEAHASAYGNEVIARHVATHLESVVP